MILKINRIRKIKLLIFFQIALRPSSAKINSAKISAQEKKLLKLPFLLAFE